MVGTVARIRLSSVISKASFKGTLKSTRIKAFLPAKEKSLNVLIGFIYKNDHNGIKMPPLVGGIFV